MKGLFSVGLVWLWLWASPAQAARLAIVIDDLGYQHMPSPLSALPPQISVSILPETPYDQLTARQARQEFRDVLLHMPMQPSRTAPLEMTTLTEAMSKEELQSKLRFALTRVPGAVAVNNHMGSALTQNPTAMGWVMEVLKQEHLAFLDSRTTARSVAQSQAKAAHIPALRRHVFLDHVPTETFIRRQLKRAVLQAKKQGTVIAIGHPHPITLSTLTAMLPEIQQQVTLVRLSELFPAGS
ncbi:divergent polysaccharide deacetylase family protein [Photobacterium sp. WH77]|uniref:divergent polysaccharide deacetylase family protein n=1 Tax=unclassified Photobacterium TaxID=2628852 RepID=UPI001EDC2AB8|nr:MULTISPECIES: divergent polysaccharide deacetylase family protein [unclassified Photobacterium]MCG2837112.1 divergent polysaccharide deacetylase family protein [Photobacterium sp. WH77]MCG2844738.1 divergent polysaccharide deacetylase family protein [Photobacterium sp. WH80]